MWHLQIYELNILNNMIHFILIRISTS